MCLKKQVFVAFAFLVGVEAFRCPRPNNALGPVGGRSPLAAPLRSSSTATPAPCSAALLTIPAAPTSGTALVWFTTCDLRVHDHEGLTAASTAANTLPVFVFDPSETVGRAPSQLRLVHQAVVDLQRSLRARGSDLIVRTGRSAQLIPELARGAGASLVYYHASPVHALRQQHKAVAQALLAETEAGDVSLHAWRLRLRAGASRVAVRETWDYKSYAAAHSPQPEREPFPAPQRLPPLPDSVDGYVGEIPAAEDLIDQALAPLPADVRNALREIGGCDAAFGSRSVREAGAAAESVALRWLNDYVMEGEIPFGRRVFAAEAQSVGNAAVAAIQDNNFDAEERLGLDAAATARIVKAAGITGLAPGEVFVRAFSPALSLGALSGRRVAAARNPGLAPNALTVQRPLRCWGASLAEAAEWHDALAERDVTVCETADETVGSETAGVTASGVTVSETGSSEMVEEMASKATSRTASSVATEGVAGEREEMQESKQDKPFFTRYWRWSGFLCRYAEGGRLDDPSAPALVMVHGFGASVDQFRRCFEELGGRYRLYALDCLGFGHSMKPALSYTQYLWADQVRDFALEVVQGPFYVAGNSIGGYTAMTVAAAVPKLCRGVVLLNSAGRLLPPDGLAKDKERFGGLSVAQATARGLVGAYRAPPNAVLQGLSQGLFWVLQGRIPQTLKWLYPRAPDVLSDGKLARDILRDSLDPGAVGIFAAGAKLPPPASANELLDRFGGPTLVVQGIKDPLNDAKARADGFEALNGAISGSVRVERVDAGHCPHEEAAAEVCAAMVTFIDRVEEDLLTFGGGSSGSSGSGGGSGSGGDSRTADRGAAAEAAWLAECGGGGRSKVFSD